MLKFEKRAYFKSQDESVGDALQTAAFNGNELLIEVLLEKGADVNAPSGPFGNALQAAAYKGYHQIVGVLLDKGANINSQGGDYGNALQAAVLNGHQQVVKLLFDKGADVNIQSGRYGNTLQAAVLNGNQQIVELLLDKGADINAQGGKYGSALQAAAFEGQQQIMELLLDKGADVHTRPKSTNGFSLLHFAISPTRHSILTLLLNAGADIHSGAIDSSGQTPSHLAAIFGNLRAIQAISSSCTNLDIDQGDVDGCTPLHRAAEHGFLDVAEWLLTNGAHVEREDYSMKTPLQHACQMGHFDMMCLLFRKLNAIRVRASDWRQAVQSAQAVNGPADSDIISNFGAVRRRNIMLTRDESGQQSVEVMDDRQLVDYFSAISYQLEFSLPKIWATTGGRCITTVNIAKAIVFLETALPLGDSPPGVYWRWWKKTREARANFGEWGEGNVWKPQLNMIPTPVALRRPSQEECFLECRVILPAYQLSSLSDSLSPMLAQRTTHAIIWIMTRKDHQNMSSSKENHILGSKVFFSTFEYGEIPNSPTDLFHHCLEELEEEWNRIFDTAEHRLSQMRTVTFHLNGRNTDLIKTHLSDAETWINLNQTRNSQTDTFHRLNDSYDLKKSPQLQETGVSWDDSLRKDFHDKIEAANRRVRDRIKQLTLTSQELIQLEFNLTSIAEAQKSTSTNRSMKRLSWITFIFLPLMFISSLFGMNVNLLESNPSWWLYIPFAAGTTVLTMTVWITFKRNSRLEDTIEGRFNFLFKPRRLEDEESHPSQL